MPDLLVIEVEPSQFASDDREVEVQVRIDSLSVLLIPIRLFRHLQLDVFALRVAGVEPARLLRLVLFLGGVWQAKLRLLLLGLAEEDDDEDLVLLVEAEKLLTMVIIRLVVRPVRLICHLARVLLVVKERLGGVNLLEFMNY